jgi:hypothetical protein
VEITHIEINETIDKIFVEGSYFYSAYLVEQLKSEKAFHIIAEIIAQSGKTPTEAIIILLAAIRYYYKDIYALKKIEQDQSFQNVLTNHYGAILKISVDGKVQGNAPDRAFPILEILYKNFLNEDICVIELGASFGLIGSCLLNPETIFEKDKNSFFENQKVPENVKKVSQYLGIDINPPEKEWLLACFSNINDAIRIDNYIRNLQNNPSFNLIKASALGFSKLKEVQEIINKGKKIIILNSFMLYQLNNQLRDFLIYEIKTFCSQNNANWICQEVEITDNADPVYYVELDGNRIMTLSDDKCSNWSWIK